MGTLTGWGLGQDGDLDRRIRGQEGKRGRGRPISGGKLSGQALL